VLQGLLAEFFIVPGGAKVFTSKIGLVKKNMVTDKDTVAPVRFIGIMEILGVLGIILPRLLQVYPTLTSLAGLGFIVVVGAFAVHFSIKEYKVLPMLSGVFVNALAGACFRF
jgi:hypothetical protein